jgi:hypothetical protein
MTREEAIEILQGAIKKPNTKDGYLGQAIDMAIKALEQEPFINKPCISSGVCEHDKNKVLDRVRAELIQSIQNGVIKIESGNEELFRIIDKYKAESEVEDGNDD